MERTTLLILFISLFLISATKPRVQTVKVEGLLFCSDVEPNNISISTVPVDKKNKTNNDTKIVRKDNPKSESNNPFIVRFTKLALEEETINKIPFELKMAQSILETGYAKVKYIESAKIFNKDGKFLRKGPTFAYFGVHLKPKENDQHDYFIADGGRKLRAYGSPWESWRDHSLFLKRPPYASCNTCDKTKFKKRKDWVMCWVSCIESSGYCQDKGYDKKLISVMNTNNLWRK